MGPFGENVYNVRNIQNVLVYALKARPAYHFFESTPRDEEDATITFINYLGKKQSV